MTSLSTKNHSEPETQTAGWNDTQMKQVTGRLLQAGVVVAATITLIGGILYLWHYGRAQMDYRLFRGEPTELRSITGTVHFALLGHRRGIIQLGLLVMIATPITRVIFAVYGFVRERDWLYVGLTLVVLLVLVFSLFWSGK